jgi:hypothetical protein
MEREHAEMKATNRKGRSTIAAGKVVTLGISPSEGRKNHRLSRKKASAMNLRFGTVTLKRTPR